ncbi:DUF456 domain-containing protein [Nocardioidaceae bacterium SCSIO 66511]|nr:DUF456 domain-containing protein [Nocardioidaceae bacterium SCSIO 66511]
MTTELLTGLGIGIGLLGILIPILPGSSLVLGAIAVSAYVTGTATGWAVLAVSTVFILGAAVVKYAWPSRRMARAGVPGRVLVVGGVAGIVGFFVIPVIGLPIGFVAGTFVAELVRTREPHSAWDATIAATKAAGLSLLVELAGALLAAGLWLGVVVAS